MLIVDVLESWIGEISKGNEFPWVPDHLGKQGSSIDFVGKRKGVRLNWITVHIFVWWHQSWKICYLFEHYCFGIFVLIWLWFLNCLFCHFIYCKSLLRVRSKYGFAPWRSWQLQLWPASLLWLLTEHMVYSTMGPSPFFHWLSSISWRSSDLLFLLGVCWSGADSCFWLYALPCKS